MRRSLSICLMAAVLAGCASGGSEINMERFTMTSDVSASAYSIPYAFDFHLTNILRSGSIVLRTSDVTAKAARHHRWSEDLERQLNIILTDAFMKQGAHPAGLLRVDVSHFEGDLEGNVLIEAAVSHEKDRSDIKNYAYRGQIPQAGYEALVREMRKGWQQVSDQIVKDWTQR